MLQAKRAVPSLFRYGIRTLLLYARSREDTLTRIA